MMASVSVSQPWPAWLAGWPSSTVRLVLSSKTPCCAQRTKEPLAGSAGTPRSRSQFLEDVAQAGRYFLSGGHRKGQSLGLAGPVVGILTHDDHPHVGEGVSSRARKGCGG